MNPTSLIVVFVIIWWLVFFMALPIGIHRDEPTAGNMNGAPKKPYIAYKMLATSAISAVLTGIYFYLVENGYIVFG